MVSRPTCAHPLPVRRRRSPVARPCARGLPLALAALVAVSCLTGCGRLAASASYNPLVRVEASDGEWVYFMVRSERRTYFGKNIFDHRLARTDDFTMVEGIGNPVHRVWAQLIGTVEAICFLPAYLVVQIENLTGIAFVIPLGQWVARVTDWLLFPFDWAAHDIPVMAAGFLWPTSQEAKLRPRGAKPLVVAKARYPASPSNFVFFLWPWFQPGYANLNRKDAKTPQVRADDVEYAPGLEPSPAPTRRAEGGSTGK